MLEPNFEKADGLGIRDFLLRFLLTLDPSFFPSCVVFSIFKSYSWIFYLSIWIFKKYCFSRFLFDNWAGPERVSGETEKIKI